MEFWNSSVFGVMSVLDYIISLGHRSPHLNVHLIPENYSAAYAVELQVQGQINVRRRRTGSFSSPPFSHHGHPHRFVAAARPVFSRVLLQMSVWLTLISDRAHFAGSRLAGTWRL
jgi:hypothetical protein